MESLNIKEIIDNTNIPIFVFNLSNDELSFKNNYSSKFDWDVSSATTFFKDNWTRIKEEIVQKNETITEVQAKNEKRKRFIFEFNIIRINQLIYCFGENKTEINEHKLMIKSFTTMVEQANKKLKQKTLELENILNTMHQATFMINKDQLVEEPVSAFSKNIFEQDIIDQDISALLYKNLNLNSEETDKLTSALATTFFEDELQWELMSDYFPKNGTIHVNGKNKTISISTYPIWNDKKLVERIMLVIQDLTEINKLKDENKEKDKKVKIIQELAKQESKDINQYFRSSLKLLAQSKGIIEILEKNPLLIKDIYRNIHTLKGHSRLLNLSIMSESAHAAEDTIKEMHEKGLDSELYYKEIKNVHQNIEKELSQYSKIAKEILKISENDVNEHIQNLIAMLLEIECHLLADSEKSLRHIDTALVACSSWALALNDDVISGHIFDINKLILNEEFCYKKDQKTFTQKIHEIFQYIITYYNPHLSPELDFETNALSFILEIAQIATGKTNRMNSPILRALYLNSSSVVLKKIFELKILNMNFNKELMLKALSQEAHLIAKTYSGFLNKLKSKAQILDVDVSFLEHTQTEDIMPSCFEVERAILQTRPTSRTIKKNTLEVYSTEINDIIHTLETSESLNREEILNKIQTLTFDSVRSRAEKFKNLIHGIAFNSNKQCIYRVEGDDFRMPPEKCNLLMDSLLHIVTNSIDHGIETTKERLGADKAEIGTIKITLNENHDSFHISVSDDGKGMDPELIYQKALKLGLTDASQSLSSEEKLDLIFHAGLSTRESVTETSGRGVGMSVVENNLKLMHSTIKIKSNPGLGCSFFIQIPKTI